MRKVIHVNPPVDPVKPTRIEIEWHAPPKKSLAEQGRELWSELHTSVTIEALAAWEERIPNFECKCKAFYNAWKIDHPPREGDFFAWTVELHNAVNAKLSKPTLTLDEARQLWMV